jgi:hypothetical protein
MLDVYQVQGIVKQSQAEFRQKFELEHPDIVEFLAEKIIEEAIRTYRNYIRTNKVFK